MKTILKETVRGTVNKNTAHVSMKIDVPVLTQTDRGAHIEAGS